MIIKKIVFYYLPSPSLWEHSPLWHRMPRASCVAKHPTPVCTAEPECMPHSPAERAPTPGDLQRFLRGRALPGGAARLRSMRCYCCRPAATGSRRRRMCRCAGYTLALLLLLFLLPPPSAAPAYRHVPLSSMRVCAARSVP